MAPRFTRSQVEAALIESAIENGGKPNFAAVRDATDWGYDRVRQVWRTRQDRKRRESGRQERRAARADQEPAPARVPDVHLLPRPDRPAAPDPASCSRREFLQWRTRDLTADIQEARGCEHWAALAGLHKQLGEARKELDELEPEDADVEITDEDLIQRLALGLRDVGGPVWEGLVRLAQEHYGARFLLPSPSGGPSMVLESSGWRASGPVVPWSDGFRVLPQSGG